MNPQAQLQHVRELVAAHDLEQAEHELESIVHPMTQIWLNHLREGGQQRLALEKSLEEYEADDPQIAAVRRLVAEDDFDGATEVLNLIDHPMTQIWQRHLLEGGRQRLELQESLEQHANDPRVAEVESLLRDNRPDEAAEVLQSMAHPMTEIWLNHLQAGGRQRLQLELPPPPAPAMTPNFDEHPEMDERMRRALELMQGAPVDEVNEDGFSVVQGKAPQTSWVEERRPQQAEQSILQRIEVSTSAREYNHMNAVDWLRAFYAEALTNYTITTGVITMALFALLLVTLTGTAIGIAVGIALAGVVFGLLFSRVDTTYMPNTEDIERRYRFLSSVLATSNANLSMKVQLFARVPPALHIAPSINALNMAPVENVAGNNTAIQNQILLRTTFFSLWAWDMLEVRLVNVRHQLGDNESRTTQQLIVLPVGAS